MYELPGDYAERSLGHAGDWATEHAEFIDAVFAWFVRVGKWPTVNALQQWLDQQETDLEVFSLAQEMPRPLGSHWRGPDGELSIRIRGLRDCTAAAPYLAAAIAVLRLAWTRYKAPLEGDSLDAADLTTHELQTAAILLQYEPFSIIHGGIDRWDPNWTGAINRALVREVRSVSSVDEYLTVEAAFYRGRGSPLISTVASAVTPPGALVVGEEARSDEVSPITQTGAAGQIFIVHGSDGQAKEALARFVRRLTGQEPVILHEQPNKGRTLIEKFEDHGELASYALVLLTGDDAGGPERRVNESEQAFTKRLRPRGRQNVVFEFGYFVGRLKRPRVAVLYEPGTELPSDLNGLAYIELDSSGGWRSQLARELDAAGFEIEWEALGKS